MAEPEDIDHSRVPAGDVEYILGGSWICKESPSGAHHWVEVPSVKPGVFVCIHCFKSKECPLTFNNPKSKKRRETNDDRRGQEESGYI